MWSGIGRLRKRTVVVVTKQDEMFRGVFFPYRDSVALVHAVFLDDEEDKPLGGTLTFPRENIKYFQET